MNFSRSVLLFVSGYGIAAVLLVIAAWLHDGDWRSGFIMLGLSAPVTVIYFFMLLAVGQLGLQSRAGMLAAGALCAAFPAFCGFFPVYFFRVKFAVLLVFGQVGLLILILAVLWRVDIRWFKFWDG